MPQLTLSLLGPAQITCDRKRVNFTYDKVRALLIYLAVEADHAHHREAVAELLWPDRESQTARHNLSQALTAMRRSVGRCGPPASFLVAARDTVQFNLAYEHWLDVAEFTARLAASDQHNHPQADACAWCAREREAAVTLYRGDFLAQYSVGDSAAFEAWAHQRREALRAQALGALAGLAAYHAAQSDWERATHFARRRTELDPLNEEAHRGLMRLLARGGQRSAALAQYEQCRQWLAEELALEPEAETLALLNAIRAGSLGAEGSTPGANHAPPLPRPRHNLPAQATAFLGREAELAQIAASLADPACRLLTLVGLGGVGKTRLALQAAGEQIGHFAHGVWFISLADLAAPALLASTLADALSYPLYGASDPAGQLLSYLAEQQTLLVLDNFEHLLEPGAALVSAIVQRCPGVRLLVTSRETLKCYGEWVLEVQGLSVPAVPEAGGLENNSAVRLFVECARRAHSPFRLRPEDRAPVTRICQLVEGMPLGIELAAAWRPLLSCAEIAHEIETSLDFLTAAARDVPERHRNMRAVFDQSWHLLTQPERAVFQRLSVFCGGFTRQAAQAVAGGSLADISRLASKSLLRRAGPGRFGMHELLRQYGAARLAERQDEATAAHEQHCAYFLDFLAARTPALKGDGQAAALAEVAGEVDNIRAAWAWAAQHGRAALIAASIDALWVFAEVRGLYAEGESYFRQAAAALEHAPQQTPGRALALGKAFVCQGSYHVRLGDAEQVRHWVERGLELLRPLQAGPEIAFGLNMLAAAAHMLGDHEQERRLLQESIALGRAAGDRWITAYSLNDLGMANFLLGHAAEAQRLCAEGLATFRQIGDRRGAAFTLNNLGVISQRLGDHDSAEQLYRESLALWRADGHRWGVATTLTRLGMVAGASTSLEASAAHYREAMRIALEVRALPAVLEAMVELAAVLACEGQAGRAREVLAFSRQHPALGGTARRRAEWLLAALPPGVAGNQLARSLEEYARGLLHDTQPVRL